MTLDGILFALAAILGFIVVLGPLVLIHELGHFVTARLANIRVLEFGIGFPPRAKVLGHDHETEYTLNYLPIGGFVRLEGEETESEDPRAFMNASLIRQLVVLAAGVVMNLIVAFLLFFIVAWLLSPGESITNVYVVPDGAAARAGLTNGVTIESLNGQHYGFMSSENILTAIADHAGQTVRIGYVDTEGQHRTTTVTLGTDRSKGILGITACAPDQPANTPCSWHLAVTYSQTDPASAVAIGLDQTGNSLRVVLGALGGLAANVATNPTSGPSGVAGPIGIAQIVGVVVTAYGPGLLLLLAAVISANLALINILPFPPFDGGKMVVMVIKRIFRVRDITALESAIYLVGFSLLMAFLVWISYFDIVRIGSGG